MLLVLIVWYVVGYSVGGSGSYDYPNGLCGMTERSGVMTHNQKCNLPGWQGGCCTLISMITDMSPTGKLSTCVRSPFWLKDASYLISKTRPLRPLCAREPHSRHSLVSPPESCRVIPRRRPCTASPTRIGTVACSPPGRGLRPVSPRPARQWLD